MVVVLCLTSLMFMNGFEIRLKTEQIEFELSCSASN